MIAVVSVDWAPLDQAAKEQQTKELDRLVEPLREFNRDSGAYINEVSSRPSIAFCKLTLGRPIHTSPTGSKHSGARITLAFGRSRRDMIRMMSFGVSPALAAKGGLRLAGICARSNDTLVFLYKLYWKMVFDVEVLVMNIFDILILEKTLGRPRWTDKRTIPFTGGLI